jgi:hypothetical protein
MAKLMDWPCCFKTVLITEERRLKLHLLADWALHFRWFTTARGPTFILFFHYDNVDEW